MNGISSHNSFENGAAAAIAASLANSDYITPSSIDTDDDPIVSTYPLYLTRPDDCEIMLLQYPLRPSYRPYGDHGRLQYVSRANDGRLKMTYALNTSSEHYDASRRSEINELSKRDPALLTATEKATLEGFKYHHLISTEGTSTDCVYSTMYMQDEICYITPLTRVLQLKPDLSYINVLNESMTSDARKKHQLEPAKDESDTNRIISHSERRRMELKAKFNPIDQLYDNDCEEVAEIVDNLTSFEVSELVQRREIEANVNMDLDFGTDVKTEHPEQAIERETIRTEIVTRRTNKGDPRIPNVHFCDDRSDYFSAICNGCNETGVGTAVSDGVGGTTSFSGPLSYYSLSKLTITDQIKEVIRVRQIIKFSDLKAFLTQQTDDNEIVNVLAANAICLHGVWVCKSDVAIPESIGRFRDVAILARDMMLCIWGMSRPLGRQKLQEMVGLPSPVLSMVVDTLYTSKDGKITPKIGPDNEFMKKYPHIVEPFAEQFRAPYASELLGKINHLKSMAEAVTAKSGDFDTIRIIGADRINAAVRKVLIRNGASTANYLLTEIKESLKEETERETAYQLRDVSGTGRSQVLNQHNDTITRIDSLSLEELRTCIVDIAEYHTGLWLLRRLNIPALDEYRQILIKMFRDVGYEGGVSKKEFQDKCIQLKRNCELPDVQIRTLFKEISVNMGGRWHWKTSGDVQSANK